MLTENTYLPHLISDQFRTAQDVARWLESIGETVHSMGTATTFARANTCSGFTVYRNGWVCRPGWHNQTNGLEG